MAPETPTTSPAAPAAPATFTTLAAPSFNCPCTIWPGTQLPTVVTVSDANAIELGVKFRASIDGFITGIRFYKGPQNTGSHTGQLWTTSGALLSTVSFSGESASGWQTAPLPQPIPVTANTTYVVSYYAPAGFYSADGGYFVADHVNGPLTAPASAAAGGNGLYRYGASGFPSETFNSANYWVDVVFATSLAGDTTAPSVLATTPAPNAVNAGVTSPIRVVFSEGMSVSSVTSSTFELRDAATNLVSAVVSSSQGSTEAVLQPGAPLAYAATYSATVKGGAAGVRDVAGNPLPADYTWVFTTAAAPFTCPCSIWTPAQSPNQPSATDTSAVEVGVKFRPSMDGYVTAVRFYKGALNTGAHVGNLWNSAGTLLGTATFTNETATGWQQASLSQPVAVTANTTYVVSYHTNTGGYAADLQYFQSSGVTTGPLTALAEGVSGSNGVYGYGSGFPSQSFQSANYWVDLVFVTSAPAPAPSISIADVTVVEGRSGQTPANFVLSLSASVGYQVSVTYSTADGSARRDVGLPRRLPAPPSSRPARHRSRLPSPSSRTDCPNRQRRSCSP